MYKRIAVIAVVVIGVTVAVATNSELSSRDAKVYNLSNSLETSREALQDVQKQKMDIDSSLQKTRQENAEKDAEIKSLNEQLQAKAAAKVLLARVATNSPNITLGDGSVWDRLATCESGNNWSINTGNGFYGGLQFDIGTWGGYKGFARADLAPREVQIEKATEVHARRGFAPWPACKSSLGL